jgi:hypothetical protein
MKIYKLALFLAIAIISSATATPLLDLSGDEFLRQTGELRLQLNLTATRAIPWLQAEAKTREMLREQKGRRERFQIDLKEQIGRASFSIENLAAYIDSEEAQAHEERRRIRQVWVSVLKGLNEPQEHQLQESLRMTLDASSMAPPPLPFQPSPSADEQPRQRSGRGNRGEDSVLGWAEVLGALIFDVPNE